MKYFLIAEEEKEKNNRKNFNGEIFIATRIGSGSDSAGRQVKHATNSGKQEAMGKPIHGYRWTPHVPLNTITFFAFPLQTPQRPKIPTRGTKMTNSETSQRTRASVPPTQNVKNVISRKIIIKKTINQPETQILPFFFSLKILPLTKSAKNCGIFETNDGRIPFPHRIRWEIVRGMNTNQKAMHSTLSENIPAPLRATNALHVTNISQHRLGAIHKHRKRKSKVQTRKHFAFGFNFISEKETIEKRKNTKGHEKKSSVRKKERQHTATQFRGFSWFTARKNGWGVWRVRAEMTGRWFDGFPVVFLISTGSYTHSHLIFPSRWFPSASSHQISYHCRRAPLLEVEWTDQQLLHAWQISTISGWFITIIVINTIPLLYYKY